MFILLLRLQDLCCLADDLRNFRIGFNLVAPGPYRVVVRAHFKLVSRLCIEDFINKIASCIIALKVRLGQGHIAESPLKFTGLGGDLSKVDGGGDVCGSAAKSAGDVRGDILDEVMEKHDAVHDVHSKGVFMGNNPRKDFENNIRTKSGKGDVSNSTKEDMSDIVREILPPPTA